MRTSCCPASPAWAVPSAALPEQHHLHVTAHHNVHAEGAGIQLWMMPGLLLFSCTAHHGSKQTVHFNTTIRCLQMLLLRQAACMQHARPCGQPQGVRRQPQQWQQELGQHQLLTKSSSRRPLHQRRCLCKCWQTSIWRSIYSR